MSRWSFLGRLCFIIYNHMLTSLFQEMWARRQGLWFLIISENNLPGPQQQRSKVPFDLTPRTKIRLRKCQTSIFFPLSFHDGLVRYCGQEQTLQWTRHSGKCDAWQLTWGAAAALTRQQMPFMCPFPNASLRTVEYEEGSGQSERRSRAAQIRAPLPWRREAGEGQC